jgi:hypothetical protein
VSYRYEPYDLLVCVGMTDRGKDGDVHVVSHIITHLDYDCFTSDFDA